ncbi:hypothetical protein ILYODFUR_009660 [Ilyodon furcidens]|uniref:Uncharacterized protein n=1 Tax=Ilyodon furcidens TaxID=33524 RepID=A0ABV0VDZ9_9TELE
MRRHCVRWSFAEETELYLLKEGYGVLVLNPNENYLEVEKSAKASPNDFFAEPSDEPAEKRERKDEQESKKKREFYEKYRNPQKETETERIPIREFGLLWD